MSSAGPALEGATDAVTYMEKPRPNATTAVWKTHRVKDDAFPEDMALQFEVENLWLDEFGAQVTSGVLVPGDMASAAGDAYAAYAAYEAMLQAVMTTPGITKTALCKALGVAKNAPSNSWTPPSRTG